MKINRKVVVMIITSAFILFLATRHRNPSKMTVDQVTERARNYFIDFHDMDVTVKSVSYEQVGEHDYLNVVKVSDGVTEYKLILNKNNKPVSDNVSAITTINSIDISAFEEELRPLGLKLHEHYDLEAAASTKDLKYRVFFSVVTEDLPMKSAITGIYSLLGMLKDEGIHALIINIDSPNFLLPKTEFGYGVGGLRLAGIGFETNIDLAKLEDQYCYLVDKVYWNEQKFNDKVQIIAKLGYENVSFFVSRWEGGNTIEIVLHCESDASLSGEQAENELADMDDSYIRIFDIIFKYTVQHEYR